MKLTTFSLARNIKNYEKRMLNSERTFEIKVRSRWAVFEILLSQQLFEFKKFSMEKRFPSIFKTINVMKLIKAILKSS